MSNEWTDIQSKMMEARRFTKSLRVQKDCVCLECEHSSTLETVWREFHELLVQTRKAKLACIKSLTWQTLTQANDEEANSGHTDTTLMNGCSGLLVTGHVVLFCPRALLQ